MRGGWQKGLRGERVSRQKRPNNTEETQKISEMSLEGQSENGEKDEGVREGRKQKLCTALIMYFVCFVKYLAHVRHCINNKKHWDVPSTRKENMSVLRHKLSFAVGKYFYNVIEQRVRA